MGNVERITTMLMDIQNNFITRILLGQRPEGNLIIQLVFVYRLYYLDKHSFKMGDNCYLIFIFLIQRRSDNREDLCCYRVILTLIFLSIIDRITRYAQ